MNLKYIIFINISFKQKEFLYITKYITLYNRCPKSHARFEFVAICAVKCWQSKKKKKNLTGDRLGLVKMERYTIEQRTYLIIGEYL